MTRDLSSIDPDKISDITQNAYYKKLQESLKERTSSHGSGKRREGEETSSSTSESERVTEVAKTLPIEDKVHISSTVWKKNKDGQSELHTADNSTPLLSSINLKHDGISILRSLGHKISLDERASQLKQSYMNSVVQARSHNFFLAKYAQFKVGIFGQLLILIGLTPDEIEAIRRKSISEGVKENEALMSENIYNLELTELVYGNSKKTKKTIKIYQEVIRQLTIQMNAFGKQNYWSKARILEEKIKQCKKIQEEFEREKELLNYQLDYFKQSI
jgi:hypothetical protein